MPRIRKSNASNADNEKSVLIQKLVNPLEHVQMGVAKDIIACRGSISSARTETNSKDNTGANVTELEDLKFIAAALENAISVCQR